MFNRATKYLSKVGSSIGAGGYDAVETTRNRKAPRRATRHEDDIAGQNTRRALIAQGRDRRRNFSILRWMISKHLDFVVPHRFVAKTADKGFNTALEQFVKYASQRQQFDSAAKHSRNQAMRLFEGHRVLDGDVFAHKLRGGYIQGIEGDLIRDPGNRKQGERWRNGVLLNRWDRELRYAVHRRNGSTFELSRQVSAARMLSLGYYDRFQQTRGISPITAALKEMGDVYEGFDYALAREKVNQLFAVAITREADDAFFEDDGEEGSEPGESDPYKLDFSKGPMLLDLDPGDSAAFLNAGGTTDQSQRFWDTVIAVSLKSIDIPFSFYREDFTNFFGSRAALILYVKSCKSKREGVVEFSNEWLTWRLREAERLGEIDLPRDFDLDRAACAGLWKWIPEGMPWWNPVQEVTANVKAINNYQRSRSEVRAEQFGDDWFDMMAERREEDEYLVQNDLPTTIPDNAAAEAMAINGAMSNG